LRYISLESRAPALHAHTTLLTKPPNLFFSRRPDRSPINDDKNWRSQDGGLSRFSVSTNVINQCASGGKTRGRASVDNSEDFVEEFEVERPPGLERHCPASTLRDLHPFEKHPPRYDIEEILKDACRRNLMSDLYNARRLSVPKDGAVMPKSPVGRPDASGPFCLMRQDREHVNVYGTLEVDRAHKKKELDMGFKVIVVTRCIDESIPFEAQLAGQFVKVTRSRQMKKDMMKREKASGIFWSKDFLTFPIGWPKKGRFPHEEKTNSVKNKKTHRQ
jgi:hypothetical protein